MVYDTQIAGFLDLFHCLVFKKLENTKFQKLDLCLYMAHSPEDRSRSNFRNIALLIFRIPGSGQGPETQ
jgi:hypothetical protein